MDIKAKNINDKKEYFGDDFHVYLYQDITSKLKFLKFITHQFQDYQM